MIRSCGVGLSSARSSSYWWLFGWPRSGFCSRTREFCRGNGGCRKKFLRVQPAATIQIRWRRSELRCAFDPKRTLAGLEPHPFQNTTVGWYDALFRRSEEAMIRTDIDRGYFGDADVMDVAQFGAVRPRPADRQRGLECGHCADTQIRQLRCCARVR